MKLKWLGHSSFLITAEDKTTILTDPYEPGGYNGALTYGAFTEPVDIVTISHDTHPDHGYTQALIGKPTIVKSAGTLTVKGINIKGIASYHDNAKGRERGSNIIFVITVDNVKVCHCGDLGHILSPADAVLIGSIDVLLLPVGGYFTINATEATQVADRLQPKLIIPMHYKTEKCAFPIAPVADFLKGKQNIRREKSSEIEITSKTLPALPEIVVLQHAL
ncbi:MAG: MBL fold metallo-hydrolase [bacterium]|nr:MBL fold metallo-hydrolase [bacterium]